MKTILAMLMLAEALAAFTAPAFGQVAGGLPFSVAIYDGDGRVVASAIPNGRTTNIYKMDEKYWGRTPASALRVGKIVSLFELHIGCSDRAKAELARLAPNNADRVNCNLLPPSVPYVVVEDPFPGPHQNMSMLCLRPQKQEAACQWVFLAVQENS
jgi:hypothetical protein